MITDVITLRYHIHNTLLLCQHSGSDIRIKTKGGDIIPLFRLVWESKGATFLLSSLLNWTATLNNDDQTLYAQLLSCIILPSKNPIRNITYVGSMPVNRHSVSKNLKRVTSRQRSCFPIRQGINKNREPVRWPKNGPSGWASMNYCHFPLWDIIETLHKVVRWHIRQVVAVVSVTSALWPANFLVQSG